MSTIPTLNIHSPTFESLVSEHSLLIEERQNLEYWTDKSAIVELIQRYPNYDKFEFLSLTKRDRRMMYIALNELSIPYSKIRIDENFAIISFVVTNVIRHNLHTYHTNSPYLIQKLHNQNNISNNMQKKLHIANLLFDIKDTMKDSMFKELMDTLHEITD